MIADLKPYPAMKDSGVAWLGEVPEHWEVRRLRTILDMRVSNVDKHTKEDETPVRLCNYVDVYKNDRIIEEMAFVRATATPDEISRFRLQMIRRSAATTGNLELGWQWFRPSLHCLFNPRLSHQLSPRNHSSQ